ncbi:MAG: TetR family transcriptional regulator [Micromonosporaceae bacterium]|nr:TetR family transcriptional regulator [Micromonosporaceae bacterium]
MTRRRRDRKEQLAGVAADLFRQRGYHAVGIGDIASAAGITGPAVYRHFTNKQDILAHVLLSGVDTLAETVARILATPAEPSARMADLTDALARLAVERRDAVALWRWLGRHLDQERQAEVRRRGEAPMALWIAELRRRRPELSAADSDLLCTAAMGVFASVADHTATLAKSRHVDLLRRLAGAVLASNVLPDADRAPDTDPTHDADPTPDARPARNVPRPGDPATLAAPRRERLLIEATRLFRQRGYHAVTIEDIGAAAGIAGPSVYRHFSSKADLIHAAGARMADRLAAGAAEATAATTSPADALRRLVDSYAETVLAHRDLMAVYIAELSSLPERQRGQLRRLQRGYVAEWVRLIAAVNPSWGSAEARVAAHAAFTVANDLARRGRLANRPGLRREIASLMRAVTGDAGGAGSPTDW